MSSAAVAVVRRLCASWLLFALCLCAPAQAREWQRADLPGIVFLSDGNRQELEDWAVRLSRFDALLSQHFAGDSTVSDAGIPLTIYLLADRGDVERLTGRSNLTGLYSPSIEGSYLIASRAPARRRGALAGEMTLFHEYAHHAMYRHFAGAYPAWYREGFAEYAAAVTFDEGGMATLGQPAWARMKHLDGRPIPLARILTATVDEFAPPDRARFYAWSWKLVQMLHASAEGRDALGRYLRAFAAGTEPLAAARDSFGDLAAFEARLDAYVPDPRGIETVSVPVPARPAAAVTLDLDASQLITLRLERLAGRDDAAAAAGLRLFAARHPENAEARRELALALAKAHGQDALQAASAALSAAPTDLRTLGVWTRIATEQAKADRAFTPEHWARLRAPIAAAVGPETRDPMAIASLFSTYLAERSLPPPSVHAAMDRALALQPESYEVRTLAVYSLAMRGRFTDARRVASVLAADPHSGAIGKRVVEALDRMSAKHPQPANP